MICTKCGTNNSSDAKFCLSCGEPLESEGTDEASQQENEEQAAMATEVPQAAETEKATETQEAQVLETSQSAQTARVSPSAEGHLGPYELLGELGRGAMARVWRAYDTNLEREVAIKEPLFDQNLSSEVLEEMGRRFVKEGRAAARLNHPNIVTIYAADVYDGRPAIVMELVEGTTLGTLLDAGALSPAEALSVLDQLLDAVGYAHKNGIIHRDIKPENIFISEDGIVKLADFGIAHVDNSSKTQATMVGTVLGTPGYMSPEQATGNPVDERSDLFSVATVGYEMLTGQNPFNPDGADSTTLLFRIVHEPAPELPETSSDGLPADMRPAIMAALSKDPISRPQNAADFKTMLHGGQVPLGQEHFAAAGNLASKVAKSNTSFPKWLPYAVVAVVLGGVLLGVFMGAKGNSGGGESYVVPETYYVSIYNDSVALFSSSNPTPVQTSNVSISELDSTTAAQLGSKIAVTSLEEGQALLESYASQTAQAKEEQAAAEAQAAQAAAEEERQRQQEEAERANREFEMTVVGADGSSQSFTVHRQGNSERIFPDSNDRLLSDAEINALTDGERCIAWNEIIAAYSGYSFKNPQLRDYFTTRCTSWYVATGGSGSVPADSIAEQNVSKLKRATNSWWLNLATS